MSARASRRQTTSAIEPVKIGMTLCCDSLSTTHAEQDHAAHRAAARASRTVLLQPGADAQVVGARHGRASVPSVAGPDAKPGPVAADPSGCRERVAGKMDAVLRAAGCRDSWRVGGGRRVAAGRSVAATPAADRRRPGTANPKGPKGGRRISPRGPSVTEPRVGSSAEPGFDRVGVVSGGVLVHPEVEGWLDDLKYLTTGKMMGSDRRGAPMARREERSWVAPQ